MAKFVSEAIYDGTVEEVDIRSKLLGNISTHLASLQGFNIMALELSGLMSIKAGHPLPTRIACEI